MAFEVASVKPSQAGGQPRSLYPLGPGDAFTGDAGFFSAANQPLIAYVRFAFKLGQVDVPGMPNWVYDEQYDIQARAQGKATKDQMRRMMQSLLTDRFKLATHIDRQIKPAFKLVALKQGQTGSQLRRHSGGNGACTGATPPPTREAVLPQPPSRTSGLQLPGFSCGSIGPIAASSPDRGRIGGRDVTLARIAAFITSPFTGIDRLVTDETGLTGAFDFSLEWVLSSRDPAEPRDSLNTDAGPTFLRALEQQLGLTLASTTAPVAIRTVDHIERPSPD
jgi:uncharacterized protein (TIGR03435 family)